jgi:C-terminal processing protease CtpA/Prc
MSDGSMMKITIAKWYTPKNKNIDHDGITPDIAIPLFERDFTAQYDRQLENAKKIIDTILSSNISYDATIEKMKTTDFTQ